MILRSSLSVGPKEKIILLDVGGESLLIGVTQGGISLISKVESSIEPSKVDDESFSEKFKQVLAKVT